MPLDKARQTHFSRSARLARKASEICLRASEKMVGESLTGLFASRGFSVAAPAVSNSLPSGIRNSSSTHTFRRLLKTHCFQQAVGSP